MRIGNIVLNRTRMLLIILIAFSFWSGTFRNTDFYSSTVIYLIMIALLGLVFTFVAVDKASIVTKDGALWIPYFLLIIGASLMSRNIERAIYWICCFSLFIIATQDSYLEKIPFKLIFCFGIVALIGTLFQMFLSNIYYSTIAIHYTRYPIQYLKRLAEVKGYVGFASSPGENAAFLVFASSVVICNLSGIKKIAAKRFVYCLLILGAFLAGERSSVLIAILVPIITELFVEKNLSKKMRRIFIIAIVVISILIVFINNLAFFSDTVLFRNFAKSFIDINNGSDITSGRTGLFRTAIEAFKTNPLFGIGLGNFVNFTGAYTDVHNSYLQVLAEQGIVGELFFLFPIIILLLETIKLCRLNNISAIEINYLRFSLFAQLYFVLYGLVANATIDMTAYVMYFVGASIMISIKSNTGYEREYLYA
ncbi:MAG: O-antigen ligase family protein [Firmicutes bacterium]|nr:O-antigen ligase family protein [Bacillota bacterium]MDY6160892.1 O-antigen ligase family protein [Candidatus Faecousia sp.]